MTTDFSAYHGNNQQDSIFKLKYSTLFDNLFNNIVKLGTIIDKSIDVLIVYI